ncbi:MAG: transposase [Moorea sp. SIO3G5]|nr:transposase [Moorena sp. SIO3G5]
MMEVRAVKRSGRGRPRIRPLRVVGDKGYTGRRIRNYLRRRGIRFTFSKTQGMNYIVAPKTREIYRQRNLIERAINRPLTVSPHRYPIRKTCYKLYSYVRNRINFVVVIV